ncbi:MAG: phosphoribosylamine--glycine ligase [Gammaproteobacteria bacterium]
MNILIIGNGGREHALAWKAAQSSLVKKVFVAPGNAGTALEDKVKNIPIDALDISALKTFALQQKIDLTIVGPETPLAAGIVDQFQAENLLCFGPSQQAAQLEASKTFSKDFMVQHNIPTAAYASFTQTQPALDYLAQQTLPIVIKADGLAAGKGVIIAHTPAQAQSAIKTLLTEKTFGQASERILIEEFLAGEEVSFIVLCDGENVVALATSQDHKARDNGDKGPNTGGMGAYSPAPIIGPALEQRIMNEVIQPTMAGMKAAGTPYTGFLYAGLMITAQGDPKVLEFNCRLGDPETQPLLMRLKSDLVALCLAGCQKELNHIEIEWDKRPALAVVLASKGYPQAYHKGQAIQGLSQTTENIKIFHAGTAQHDADIVTDGGRVLAVTALGDSFSAAQRHAYDSVKKISWQDIYYRDDIGYRALTYKTNKSSE